MADVSSFFRWLHKDVSVIFHPDDDFTDYVDMLDTSPTFSQSAAGLLNEAMSLCFEICEAAGKDIYEIGLTSHPINTSL